MLYTGFRRERRLRQTGRMDWTIALLSLVAGLAVANGLVLALIVSSDGVVPWVVTLGGLAWLNYAGIRWYRAWSASRQGNVIDEMRYGLSAWLMPRNRAAAG